jgi:hypothetical protein
MFSEFPSERSASIVSRPSAERIATVLLQLLAYCCGLAVVGGIIVSMTGLPKPARLSLEPEPVPASVAPAWIAVERPFPAFALAIPEAGDTPVFYAILRHPDGGRKDVLTLGKAQGSAPYLTVEIYRPGTETAAFAAPERDIQTRAGRLGPLETARPQAPLFSKFGPFAIEAVTVGGKTPRRCIGFSRTYDEPRLQIAGLFCQGDDTIVDRGTLACALDRLTLVSSGSDPGIGALFAQAELRRSFCGQRSILMTPTPKYPTLWKALDQRGSAR